MKRYADICRVAVAMEMVIVVAPTGAAEECGTRLTPEQVEIARYPPQ
jgi:hypothetical protein